MNYIPVCTIYAKRKLHLQNLVKGLMQSSVYPDELVIVCMNDRLPDLPQAPFKIITAIVNTDNGILPLAAARNKAAAMAKGDKLIFLDVDCISDRDLVSNYIDHLEREDALDSGTVVKIHTDFAFTTRSQELPCYKIGALAYHQFHASSAPPLNHLAEIVSNARVSYYKRQILPMDKWLQQFDDLTAGEFLTQRLREIGLI